MKQAWKLAHSQSMSWEINLAIGPSNICPLNDSKVEFFLTFKQFSQLSKWPPFLVFFQEQISECQIAKYHSRDNANPMLLWSKAQLPQILPPSALIINVSCSSKTISVRLFGKKIKQNFPFQIMSLAGPLSAAACNKTTFNCFTTPLPPFKITCVYVFPYSNFKTHDHIVK